MFVSSAPHPGVHFESYLQMQETKMIEIHKEKNMLFQIASKIQLCSNYFLEITGEYVKISLSIESNLSLSLLYKVRLHFFEKDSLCFIDLF